MSNNDDFNLQTIESIMTEVRRNWSVMLQSDFNPILTALEILERSNPSHTADSFISLNDSLIRSMDYITDKYYGGFNNAVSIFGGIVDNVNTCATLTCDIKKDLGVFHDSITANRTDLKDLSKRLEGYKHSLQDARKLNEAKKAREEAFVYSGKWYFLPAAERLKYAIELVESIGHNDTLHALDEDRINLLKIMAESFSELLFSKDDKQISQLRLLVSERVPDLNDTFKEIFNQTISITTDSVTDNDLSMAPTDFDFDPRTTVIAFVRSIGKAVCLLEGVEIFSSQLDEELPDRILEICKNRFQIINEQFKRGHKEGHMVYVGTVANERKAFESLADILHEGISTLLIDLTTVAWTCGFLTESIQDTLQRPELWDTTRSPAQHCLLHIHSMLKSIVDACTKSSSPRRRPLRSTTISCVNAIISHQKPTRTEIDDIDWEFDNCISKEELDKELEDFWAIFTEEDRVKVEAAREQLKLDPRFGDPSKAFPLPVKQDIQFIVALYKPLHQFMTWTSKLYSEDEEVNSVRHHLESIMQKEYTPMLISTFSQTITSCFSKNSFFEPTDGVILPCFKIFWECLKQQCALLHQLKYCQNEIEMLIQSTCSQFIEQLNLKVKDLLTHKSPSNDDLFSTISYSFAQHPEIFDIYQQLLKGKNEILFKKEILLFEKLKQDRSLHPNELISNPRTIKQIAYLHLNMLRTIDELAKLFEVRGQDVYVYQDLRMSTNFALSHQTIIDTILGLKDRYLFTLRAELRCRSFYYLDLAFREGRYMIQRDPCLPDLYITKLVADMTRFTSDIHVAFNANEYTSKDSTVPERECKFVLEGIDAMIQDIMVTNLRYVRALNLNGVKKILVGIRAMEQALAILGNTAGLDQAKSYYELLLLGDYSKMVQVFGESDFGAMQWQCLLDTVNTLEGMGEYKGGSSEIDTSELKREQDNAKIRLKYLIEEQKRAIAA